MSETVRLKGYPNGIQIVIDKDAELEEVLAQVAEKFKDSEKFFGKSKKVLSFEGKRLTQEEEDAIVNTIRESCSLSIVCVISKDTNEAFEQALQEKQQEKSDKAQFFRGNVGRRDVLEMEQSVIILGNVESGGLVISQGDIIVLGELLGNAYAGVDGRPHFIAALHMEPEKIRIGETKGKYMPKNRWRMGRKDTPKIAYLKDAQIVFEDIEYTEELLQNL